MVLHCWFFFLFKECTNNTFGPNCTNTYSNCSDGGQCNHTDGRCLHGCNNGTHDGYAVCPSNRYGNNCQENCSINCGVPERCDRITGHCEGGCQEGWKGSRCDSKEGIFIMVVTQCSFTYASYMYPFNSVHWGHQWSA